jgi:hypothetical protein
MDAAKIQERINRGYGIAARFLGASFDQYRPIDPMAPLSNQIGSFLADFDVNPAFTYAQPSKYGNAVYYGLFDATSVVPYDYLVGATGTWFVAGMEPNKPVLCVACNCTVSFMRPADTQGRRDFYGGDSRDGEDLLAKDVPVSELQGTKGERGAANLPGDVRSSWAQFLVPQLPGFTPTPFDRAYDSLGRAWTISSLELTNLGWRMTAAIATT